MHKYIQFTSTFHLKIFIALLLQVFQTFGLPIIGEPNNHIQFHLMPRQSICRRFLMARVIVLLCFGQNLAVPVFTFEF